MPNQRNLPMQMRSLPVSSVDTEARTAELVWSTGAAVRRYDWYEGRYYDETLSLEPGHVDLSRLNAGAPLLNTHRTGSLDDVIGVVERAWVAGGEARALVRFSEREDVEPIWRDVQAGIIRNVSVGYSVRKFLVTEHTNSNDAPEYRAIDWEPGELSLVPVGADAGAGVRAVPEHGAPCEYVRLNQQEPQDMPKPNENTQSLDDTRAAADAAVKAERARATEIRALARSAGASDDLADALIESGSSIDAARAQVLDAMISSRAAPTANVQTLRDETDTRREAMRHALAHRSGVERELHESAREYRGMSLSDLARECVEQAGGKTRGMTKTEIVDAALGHSRAAGMHTVSDFPVLLVNTANRSIMAGYELAPQTFRPLVRETTVPDFRTVERINADQMVGLKKINEHGEYESSSLTDGAAERYKVETFGRIVNISRQVIVNDDMSVFTDTAFGFGRAASNLESDLVWGLITGNAKLADGLGLFHANHANIASAGAISVDELAEARKLMRLQKNRVGDRLNLSPDYVLVPVGLEMEAMKQLAIITPTKAGDVNPFSRMMTIISDPRLDDAAAGTWYVAAGSNQGPAIELAYLDGQRGLRVSSQDGFEVDGVRVKAALDVGVGLMDYRWIVRNTGV